MDPECFLVPPHSGAPTCPLDVIRWHDLLAWPSQDGSRGRWLLVSPPLCEQSQVAQDRSRGLGVLANSTSGGSPPEACGEEGEGISLLSKQ